MNNNISISDHEDRDENGALYQFFYDAMIDAGGGGGVPAAAATTVPTTTMAAPPPANRSAYLERWLGDASAVGPRPPLRGNEHHHDTPPSPWAATAHWETRRPGGANFGEERGGGVDIISDNMANLATANALATADMLNAQLFEHICGSDSGRGGDGGSLLSSVAAGGGDGGGEGAIILAAAFPSTSPPPAPSSSYYPPSFERYRFDEEHLRNNNASSSSANRHHHATAITSSSASDNSGGLLPGSRGGGLGGYGYFRCPFTQHNIASSLSQPPSQPPVVLSPFERRHQQRLRDYERHQQQLQLRHYERQYHRRLRSNLITESMSHRQRLRHEREEELRRIQLEERQLILEQQREEMQRHQLLHRQLREQQQQQQQHPYLPRAARSSSQSLERSMSLQELRDQRRLQLQQQQEQRSHDEMSTLDWNARHGERSIYGSINIGDHHLNPSHLPPPPRAETPPRPPFGVERGGGAGDGGMAPPPINNNNRNRSPNGEELSSTVQDLELTIEHQDSREGSGGGGGAAAGEDPSTSSSSAITTTTTRSSTATAAAAADTAEEEMSASAPPPPPTNNATSTTLSSSIPLPPSRRSRRLAAVRGLERISTAIATGGMGADYDDDDDDNNVDVYESSSKKKPTKSSSPLPESKKPSSSIFSKTSTCCICLEIPTEEELSTINGCEHPYCFTCIETWADRENTCPLCKSRFTKIEKVNYKSSKRKRGDDDDDDHSDIGDEKLLSGRKSKRVRNRNQRADINMINPSRGYFSNLETSVPLPAQIAQLLFSGLGASTSTFGFGRHRPSAAAAAASRSSSSRAASSAASASSWQGRHPFPPTQHRFSQRGPPTDAIQDFVAVASIPMPPVDLPDSPLDPFGPSPTATSFGAPSLFGFSGGPGPTPWNSSLPSSTASPFGYHGATSRAYSQGAAVAAASASASAAASSFNPFSGPMFEGLFSGHDDNFLHSLSPPPPPPPPPQYAHHRRERGDNSTSRTIDYEYLTTHPARRRNIDSRWRGAPSSQNNNFGPAGAAAATAAAAGRSRETALEIDDSDNEVIEVIDLVS